MLGQINLSDCLSTAWQTDEECLYQYASQTRMSRGMHFQSGVHIGIHSIPILINIGEMKMANQVMSLAAYKCEEVSRPALSGVVLPPTTDSYRPIGHDWLLNLLEDSVRDNGMAFGSEHHGLSHDGARYFGLIELKTGEDNPDYRMLMGVRNSLDKRFGAQVAFGNRVMVCANLSFFGNYMLGRKHTTFIERDLPALVQETLSNIPELRQLQDNRFNAYREAPLSTRNADHLIMNMLREGAVNTSRIEKVIKEWDEPTFDHGDRTVWRAFNAATQALKGCNIFEMPDRTINLQRVCDHASGFKAAA
jgi:hypothetical protein